MKDGFADLDKWEDLPNRKLFGKRLKDGATISERGCLAIAHNVTLLMGNPPTIKLQRMIQEGMLFIRILPSKDPTARKLTYGDKNASPLLTTRDLLSDDITPYLPLRLDLVRVNEKEAVFVGLLDGNKKDQQ